MDRSEPSSSAGLVVERKRRSFLADLVIRLVKEKPLGTVAAVITLIAFLTAIFADLIAPYGLNQMNAGPFLSPPSGAYWMGTDNLGRDIFSRIVYGARISVIIGLAGSTFATFNSVIIGLLSGYIGGKFDLILQRFVDAWMCFPGLIILMVLISIIGPGMWQVVVVLGIHWGIGGSRILRGSTMSVKNNVYVEAAVAVGCSTPRLLFRHVLPNISVPTIILFCERVPSVIITEATLSFLGFGIPPPNPSWGGMLTSGGRSYMFLAPWMAIWPGVALSLVIGSVYIFGDALRDLLDPRLRGGIGRYGLRAKK